MRAKSRRSRAESRMDVTLERASRRPEWGAKPPGSTQMRPRTAIASALFDQIALEPFRLRVSADPARSARRLERKPRDSPTPNRYENSMATKNSLTITDNRTSKTYELPIVDGTVPTMGLRAIKTDDKDFGLMG